MAGLRAEHAPTFSGTPETCEGMVEAALLHAHHMFDGLCERSQPHISLFCTVLCLGLDPHLLALLMRRNALPCFAPASCVLVSCSFSKDVVRVGRSCHEQGALVSRSCNPVPHPCYLVRRKLYRTASLPCHSTVVPARRVAAPCRRAAPPHRRCVCRAVALPLSVAQP
jgi:hypothetical protein